MVQTERNLSSENLRRTLPSRVKDAVGAIDRNHGKSGRVVDPLVTDLLAQPEADLLFVALDVAQKEALTGRTPKLKKAGVAFANRIAAALSEAEEDRDLIITPYAIPIAHKLVTGYWQIESQRFLASDIDPEYTRLVHLIGESATDPNASEENITVRFLTRKSREANGSCEMTIKDWQREFDRNDITDIVASNQTDKFDNTITLLKTQPDSPVLPNIWKHEVNGLTLEQIEQMIPPLERENYARVTQFFHEVLSQETTPALLYLREVFVRAIQTPLSERFGVEEENNTQIANRDLLRVIKDWRLQFFCNFLYGNAHAQREAASVVKASLNRKIIQGLDDGFMLTALDHNAVIGLGEGISTPFYAKAWKECAPPDHIDRYFAYREDVSVRAYATKFLGDYQRRMIEVTKATNTIESDKELALVKRKMDKIEVGKDIRGVVTDEFLTHFTTETFREETKKHAADFTDQATTVWKDIKSDTAHTLPLQEGIDIIHVKKDSLPYLMGIEKIAINRVGDADWGIRVRFDFRQELPDYNDRARVTGTISPDGKFVMNANLPTNSEHFRSLFHLIATLACRDLTAQVEKKRIFTENNGHPVIAGYGESPTNIPRIRIYREHKEEDLEDDVRPKIPVELHPHKIGLHASRLPGVPAYEYARYMRNAAREVVIFAGRHHPIQEDDHALPIWSQIFTELDERVDTTFDQIKGAKPSEIKINTWPDGIPQGIIRDRRSDKVVHANTWTTEHITPKLSEQEEAEVALWQRQYKNIKGTQTSALASLDEYKPLLAA